MKPYEKNQIPESMIVRLKKIREIPAAANDDHEKSSDEVVRRTMPVRAHRSFNLPNLSSLVDLVTSKVGTVRSFVSSRSQTTKIISWALMLGVVLGGAAFFVTYHLKPKTALSVPVTQAQKAPEVETTAVEEIVKRVGALMALPQGEEPTIALVSDVNSLKDQAFFKNAKNGDFVLMYAKAKRAILFDSLANKIIEVAPIVDTPTTP